LEAGILTTAKAPLKVLGNGEISNALTVKAAAFTKSAKAKIEEAGGTCEVVS
jgi:large subunit ribosomal protein L15